MDGWPDRDLKTGYYLGSRRTRFDRRIIAEDGDTQLVRRTTDGAVFDVVLLVPFARIDRNDDFFAAVRADVSGVEHRGASFEEAL